jgi:hypothetical protein
MSAKISRSPSLPVAEMRVGSSPGRASVEQDRDNSSDSQDGAGRGAIREGSASLRRRGVKTARGGRWTHRQVGNVLARA